MMGGNSKTGYRRLSRMLAAIAVVSLFPAGCGAAPESPGSQESSAGTTVLAAPSEAEPEPVSPVASALAEMFLEDWETMDRTMMLPTVAVFQIDRVEGLDRAVFFVWPACKNTMMKVFGVAGDTVTRIGGCSAGLEFALSNTKGGALRTSWSLAASSGGGEEDFDLYLTIDPDKVSQTLSVSLYTAGDTQTASLYRNGEGEEIPLEDYRAKKAGADADFADARTIRFDLRDFQGFDLESGEDLAAYIQGQLERE